MKIKYVFIFLIIWSIFGVVCVKNVSATEDPFPEMKFPWESGLTKTWSVGIHGGFSTGYCQDTTYPETRAVDFSGRFEVLTVAGGVVTEVGTKSDGCNYVTIKHNNTWVTEYDHLESWEVSVNDQVVQGQVIGISGHTGNSSGDHLHLALFKWNGTSFVYETLNDKVIDGWRFHEIRSWGGDAPLYAEATATQGDNWQGTRSAFTDAYCGTNKDTQTWLSDDVNNTKVSSATIVANDKTYNSASFPSTNVRQETNPCGGSNVVLENMTIGSGQDLDCSATNSITLSPNFSAESGSNVHLYIDQ